MTKLEQAIREERLEELKQLLLAEPALIEQKNEEGIPYCLLAAQTGNYEIIKYIVEYSRASMNTVDDQNRNMLHYAATANQLDAIVYLVERVDMKILGGDSYLQTPLDIAHRNHYVEQEKYYEFVLGLTYEELYRNPIRTGMFPDPSIVRVGEDYYMANSSFIYFPCIPISHSRDLLHWEIIGYAITNPEWAALDELEGGRGYWAPDLSYDKGTFYVTATYRLNDTGTTYRRQIIVSAKKPEGPYSKPAVIEEDGIDPSIFHAPDGRHYMLLNRGARILELDETCTRQISKAELLYYGDYKRAPEGPHLLWNDGYYYLFEAEGGTGEGHRITVSRSKQLKGIYEPCPYNPIMRQTDPHAGLQRCGHGKPVCTQKGEWFMVYLCGRRFRGKDGHSYSILGRETALDPITWTMDGWPLVNHLQGPSVLQKKPDLPQTVFPQSDREDFTKQEPGKQWISPRPPQKNGVVWEAGGLKLKGSRAPLSDVAARNLLLRRQTDFVFTAETVLKMPENGLRAGEETGLVCYYDENTWVSFGIQEQTAKKLLQIQEHIGTTDYRYHIILPNTYSEKKLLLGVTTTGLKRTFYYQDPGKREAIPVRTLDNVYYLCDEGIAMGKRFTGAMVGMYALSAGQDSFTGQFLKFNYYSGMEKCFDEENKSRSDT